jgi:hypothetical protein
MAQGNTDDAETIAVAEHTAATRNGNAEVKWAQRRVVIIECCWL